LDGANRGIIQGADEEIGRSRSKQKRPRNLASPLDCSNDRKAARLLRPPAIVPNLGAIYPRNRPAVDTACSALQRVIWNIDIENYLVTFDAISNVSVHGTVPPQAFDATRNNTAK
jgi:hypothetical protein